MKKLNFVFGKKKKNSKKFVLKNYFLGMKFKISFSKRNFDKNILRKWVIKRTRLSKIKKVKM